MKNMNFNERCYHVLRRVPRGKITTYKAIAHCLGTHAYRAVGNAMNRNPHAPRVPCHRVVKSDGQIGGYAKGGKTKTVMLRKEGIEIKNGRIINLARYLCRLPRPR